MIDTTVGVPRIVFSGRTRKGSESPMAANTGVSPDVSPAIESGCEGTVVDVTCCSVMESEATVVGIVGGVSVDAVPILAMVVSLGAAPGVVPALSAVPQPAKTIAIAVPSMALRAK
jgi:hypothetical protein